MAISHHRLSERLTLQSLLHAPSGWINETKALFRPGDSQVAENHHRESWRTTTTQFKAAYRSLAWTSNPLGAYNGHDKLDLGD